MVDALKGMLGRPPVERTPATLAFGLHKAHAGILLAQPGQQLAALPLQAHATDGGGHGRVGEHPVYYVKPVGVYRSEENVDLRVLTPHGRHEIFHVETDDALGSPSAPGVWRIAPGLVLKHHHANLYAFGGIFADETAEVVGIGLKVAGVLNHVVGVRERVGKGLARGRLVVVAVARRPAVEQIVLARIHSVVLPVAAHRVVGVNLHPARRAPGRRPERHSRHMLLRRPYEGNDGLAVAVDAEILQFEVTRHLVAAVPRARIVVGVHRYAAHGEPQVAVGGEHAVQ